MNPESHLPHHSMACGMHDTIMDGQEDGAIQSQPSSGNKKLSLLNLKLQQEQGICDGILRS